MLIPSRDILGGHIAYAFNKYEQEMQEKKPHVYPTVAIMNSAEH